MVWMGSHNLTRNALVRNDETFLLTDDASRIRRSRRTSISGPIVADARMRPAGSTQEQAIEEEANTECDPLIKENSV